MRYIQLRTELIHARYDEATGKWHLRLKRPVANSSPDAEVQYEEFEDTADFVVSGVGALSRWSWPDLEGLWDFKGKVLHSAGWEVGDNEAWQDKVKDWKDKKIGVIGVVRTSFV